MTDTPTETPLEPIQNLPGMIEAFLQPNVRFFNPDDKRYSPDKPRIIRAFGGYVYPADVDGRAVIKRHPGAEIVPFRRPGA